MTEFMKRLLTAIMAYLRSAAETDHWVYHGHMQADCDCYGDRK